MRVACVVGVMGVPWVCSVSCGEFECVSCVCTVCVCVALCELVSCVFVL